MAEPKINVPWPVWAIVTMSAALISGPLATKMIRAPDAVPQNGALDVSKSSVGSLPERQTTSVPLAAPGPASDVSHTRMLTTDDLVGKSEWELDILRNEIYARHGRRFSRADLSAYFASQPWYSPRFAANAFPEDILTPVEKFNAELIAEYQRKRFGRR